MLRHLKATVYANMSSMQMWCSRESAVKVSERTINIAFYTNKRKTFDPPGANRNERKSIDVKKESHEEADKWC